MTLPPIIKIVKAKADFDVAKNAQKIESSLSTQWLRRKDVLVAATWEAKIRVRFVPIQTALFSGMWCTQQPMCTAGLPTPSISSLRIYRGQQAHLCLAMWASGVPGLPMSWRAMRNYEYCALPRSMVLWRQSPKGSPSYFLPSALRLFSWVLLSIR